MIMNLPLEIRVFVHTRVLILNSYHVTFPIELQILQAPFTLVQLQSSSTLEGNCDATLDEYDLDVTLTKDN